MNISGTGNRPNTRMRTLFNRLNHRMKGSISRYWDARSALLSADPEGEWQNRLQDLKNADVRGPGKDDFYIQEPTSANPGASRGRYEISWIWLVPQSKSEVEADSSEQVLDEGMRVEWAKSQARRDRWEEEVHLIQEEMRRSIVYYEWKETWWLERQAQSSTGDVSVQHGTFAYAQKQVYYCRCLAESFAIAWLPFLQAEGIKPEWEDKYSRLIGGKATSTGTSTNNSPNQQSQLGGKEEIDGEVDEEEVGGKLDDEEIEEMGQGSNGIYDAFELDD